jgi:hypothetical protein
MLSIGLWFLGAAAAGAPGGGAISRECEEPASGSFPCSLFSSVRFPDWARPRIHPRSWHDDVVVAVSANDPSLTPPLVGPGGGCCPRDLIGFSLPEGWWWNFAVPPDREGRGGLCSAFLLAVAVAGGSREEDDGNGDGRRYP